MKLSIAVAELNISQETDPAFKHSVSVSLLLYHGSDSVIAFISSHLSAQISTLHVS